MNVATNDQIRSMIALNALMNVTDPEIGLDIVNLGLIYELKFNETLLKIYCTMTLTTQFCPMGESIINAAEETLRNSFPAYEVDMNLVFDPPWNYERISEEGRIFLNK